ncbi:MAG: c-type cytochrome biogenesis protein CcmI [Acidobacteriota bacterium]|nr:c-type cytochrome biogenesis protein CcmI [Acidobacteriota bacterium]
MFWLICAVFVAIALAFVLPPLLQTTHGAVDKNKKNNVDVYRDQISELQADLKNGIISSEQYNEDRDEIEGRLLEDVSVTEKPLPAKSNEPVAGRGSAYAIALAIPVIAIALYLRVGNSAAISGVGSAPVQAPSANSSQGNGEFTPQRIEANIAALAKRLEQNPSDAQGWIMLGRSYTALEKYSEASDAYAKATALKADDANLWADYAFAMAMVNGQRIQGPPLELVKKALKLDPENPKALELAGSAAFETKNYKEALDYWQRLLQKTPPDSELARALSQRISEAKSLAGTMAK